MNSQQLSEAQEQAMAVEGSRGPAAAGEAGALSCGDMA